MNRYVPTRPGEIYIKKNITFLWERGDDRIVTVVSFLFYLHESNCFNRYQCLFINFEKL